MRLTACQGTPSLGHIPVSVRQTQKELLQKRIYHGCLERMIPSVSFEGQQLTGPRNYTLDQLHLE